MLAYLDARATIVLRMIAFTDETLAGVTRHDLLRTPTPTTTPTTTSTTHSLSLSLSIPRLPSALPGARCCGAVVSTAVVSHSTAPYPSTLSSPPHPFPAPSPASASAAALVCAAPPPCTHPSTTRGRTLRGGVWSWWRSSTTSTSR